MYVGAQDMGATVESGPGGVLECSAIARASVWVRSG